MQKTNIRRLVFSALFAALIFVTTAYVLHIPTGNGYIHLGDSLIYLAASFLPAPFAMVAAAVGAGLSDALTGYPQYVLFTIIIKPLNALCFSAKGDRILTVRNRIAPLLCILVTGVGYYLADGILYGSWYAWMATLPGNLIQSGGSMAVYYILALAFDRAGFKKRFTV